MAAIGQKLAPKLQRLLLLLSSDQPGEIVAAAAAIKRTLKSEGHDFHDLVAGLISQPAKPNFRDDDDRSDAGDWRAMRDACLDCPTRLRDREREFLNSLRKWRGGITPKQRDWLQAIYDRVNN